MKIFDKILHKCGIRLVYKPIDYVHDYKYNTNILLSYRQVNKMISIIIKFDPENLPLEMDFDTKFSEFLDSVAKKTTYFRDLDQDDIIIYNKELLNEDKSPIMTTIPPSVNQVIDPPAPSETQNTLQPFQVNTELQSSKTIVHEVKYVKSIALKLTQVESGKDFHDFVDDFGESMKEQYGKGIEFKYEQRKTFF